MLNAIEIKELVKEYPGFRLDGLDLTLPSGSIMGLVGENGAGKSTTIKLIMNAVRRDSGTVSVLGADNQSAAFAAVKENIGVVLDEAYYPEVLNAKDVGRIMADTYRNWEPDTFEDYIRRFGLPWDKAFKNYSRGMKMKLAIAVALSHQARLLILDEATSGLDPMVRDEILDIFNEYTRQEDRSILLSSHIVSDLEKLCDYIAFLHKGKLVLCEEKDRLLEEYALVRLSHQRLADLPEDSVVGVENDPYGVRALVRRDMVPHDLPLEHTNLEDIILFLAKGGTQK